MSRRSTYVKKIRIHPKRVTTRSRIQIHILPNVEQQVSKVCLQNEVKAVGDQALENTHPDILQTDSDIAASPRT